MDYKYALTHFSNDPTLEPENSDKTVAEMTMSEKNNCSHRARAFDKMASYLSEK